MKNSITKVSKIHLRFQISLLFLILVMLIILTFSILFAVLSVNKNISRQRAEQLFSKTGQSIILKLDSQLEKAIQFAGLMTHLQQFSAEIENNGQSHPGLPFMFEALKHNSYFYSVYAGFENGDFIQLINTLGSPLIINAHSAPDETAFILRAINSSEGNRTEYWTFFDSSYRTLGSAINNSPDYFPSERPWYISADQNRGEVILTEPYVYNSLKQPGITAASSVSGLSVAGIDITLSGLNTFLDSMFISPGTGIIVLTGENRVLASSRQMSEKLGISGTELSKTDPIQHERNQMLWENPWTTPGGQNYRLVITAPASDFLQHQYIIQRQIILISIIIFVLFLPAIIVSSKYLSRFLENLADDAEKIQNLVFDEKDEEHSFIIEFDKLAEAFRVMKKAIAAKTKALQDAKTKLERIINLGIAMTVEEDTDKLIEMILTGAKEISHADGGSLYLKGDKDELDFRIVFNDSLGFIQGGTSKNRITMPPVCLYDEDGTPNFHNVVSCAFHKGKTIVIEDAYKDPDFDFSGTRKFDELNNYRSKSFITVPLKLEGSEILGALQLINCMPDKTGGIVPFNSEIRSFVEALSALAAVILYNRSLMESQEALFEALIRLIASAIDTKSPYTGGHCERVPVLATMLADAAEKAETGSLGNFRFQSQEDRKAFIIGAWLHDAGKMTTPEFVVDKAVKLETIYNRIHEIRTRFEILLRDELLKQKEALLAGRNPEAATAELEAAVARLHDDFNFIASCNTGENPVAEECEKRITELSRITWTSHFDHTIGLSREEAEKTETPFVMGKTIEEPLIADKPAHIIADRGKTKALYESYGFALPKPSYLYNRGEIHNLMIWKGTLTDEERFKVNEHIMQTIVMLDQLPFPKGLHKIPEYVGTHHETLSGKGYPRGLDASKLSIPSRIMAIADIFEALTAADRPYKNAYKLSKAIAILHELAVSRHIDSDLFELFLTSGIYRKYAEQYLPPEMIDEVDINKYLGQ